MTANLSNADVARLLQDPSPDARAEAAAKIAAHYESAADFGVQEKKLAEEIFAIMCKDAEIRVREALAANLKDCPFLPHDIAVTLAYDVESVALPILEFSAVLTDEDLIDIIRSQGEDKQKAIAGRSRVSSDVSDALIETRNESVVGVLVANNGAQISTPAMQRVLDDFADSELVKRSMAGRRALPVEVTERLLTMVSSQIQQQLIGRHDLTNAQIADLVVQSREKATLDLIGPGKDKTDVRRLIVHLYRNKRLTPTIVLRALCLGDMDFFESSIAVLSRIPLADARHIIHGKDDSMLQSLLDKAGVPRPLCPAFAAAISVADENRYDGGEHDRERFRRRMIERIVTHFDDPDDVMGDENIQYLLGRLSRIDHGFSLGR